MKMAQNVSASDLCIVCNSANIAKRSNLARKLTEFTGTKKQRQRLEEELLIVPQLRPLFLLKEIFQRPMSNAKELLKRMGNPSEWFAICGPCGDHIDQAIEVQKKMKTLEERLKKIKKGLRRKLKTSDLQEIQLVNEEVGTSDVVEERRAALRLEIRKRIRPSISQGYEFARATTDLSIPTKQPAPEVKTETEVNQFETDLMDVDDEAYFDLEHVAESGGEQSDSEDHAHGSRCSSFVHVEKRDEELVEVKKRSIDASNPPPKKQKRMLPPRRILPDRTKPPEIINNKKVLQKRNKKKRKPYYYVPITEGVDVKKPDTSSPSELQDFLASWKAIDLPKAPKNSLDDCESDDPTYLPGRPLSLRKKKTVKRLIFIENEDNKNVNDLKQNEEKRKQKKNTCFKSSVQRAKNLIRKRPELSTDSTNKSIPFKPGRWKRLFDCGHELLDMTLITYPPKTAEQKRKIPKEFAEKEIGTLQKEHGENPSVTDFGCPSCGKYFTHKYFVISHIHRFHLGIRRHWSCNKCSMKFVDARRLLNHLNLHDAGQILTCPICNTFSSCSQKKIDNHVAYHQKSVPNPSCDPCGKIYPDFHAYVHHMEVEHGVKLNRFRKRTVVCELCSDTFKTYRRLKFHQVVSHGYDDEEGQFPICHCGKRYMKASSLEDHIQKDHIKAKNFFCDQCGLGYAVETQLRNHIASAHSEASPNPCHVCGILLLGRREFVRHLGKHHPETTNMSTDELEAHVKKLNEEKPHKCKLCDKGFPFSVTLYHHYRKEHEEVTDKYKCSVCGKGYSRACSVKRHYETVHEKRTATCQYCNKELPISSLYQHLNTTKSCGAKRKAELEAQNSTGEQLTTSSGTSVEGHKITPFLDPFRDNQQPTSSRMQQQFENLNEPATALMNATQERGRWEEVPLKFSYVQGFLPHSQETISEYRIN